ncbi:MAG: MBL fold metallo-hydrolase, partial [Deltaproteobacteria bacterium]|nr:MBL fold metallo-hydrolase [Deltaproteobacteria bacterium]
MRGSYPVPGVGTNRYGGNTACVEVRPADGTVIIIDAGTGIRKLGQALVAPAPGGDVSPFAEGRGHSHLLISHTHWDHIQGLPFFAPLYVPGNVVTIYGRQREVRLGDIFASQTRDPYFPVSLGDVGAEVVYRELIEGTHFFLGESSLGESVSVHCARLNHPYIAVGYRVDADGGSVAYICDTAPFDRIVLGDQFVPQSPDIDEPPGEADAAVLEAMRQGVVELCRDVDLVIYDTMFEMSEYRAFPHWGHSTPDHAVAIAQEAGARAVALFHHHPRRDDEAQDAIVARTAESAEILVLGAKEGLVLECHGAGIEER